jgi:hypothetical protein
VNFIDGFWVGSAQVVHGLDVPGPNACFIGFLQSTLKLFGGQEGCEKFGS